MEWSRRRCLQSTAVTSSIVFSGCASIIGRRSATPTQSSETQAPTNVAGTVSNNSETSAGGCDQTNVNDSGWYIRPNTEPNPIEPLECKLQDFKRKGDWIDESPVWGSYCKNKDVKYTLRVAAKSYTLGDKVNIRFRNVSEEVLKTGNPHKIDIDILTEDGWMAVRGWQGDFAPPVPDDLYELKPDETHEWSFELSKEGIIEVSHPANHELLKVCPDLKAGRYRFGFAPELHRSIVVAFDVNKRK